MMLSQEELAPAPVIHKEKKKGIFSSGIKDFTGGKDKPVTLVETEDSKESIREYEFVAAAVVCLQLSIMIRQWDPGQLTCSMTVTAYIYHGNVFFEFLHSLSFLFDRGSLSVFCIVGSSCLKLWDPGGRLLQLLGYHCLIQQMKVLELSQVMQEDVLSVRNEDGREVELLNKWKDLPDYENSWESMSNQTEAFPDFHLEDKVNLLGGSIDRDQVIKGQIGKTTNVYKCGEWKPISWDPQNQDLNSK